MEKAAAAKERAEKIAKRAEEVARREEEKLQEVERRMNAKKGKGKKTPTIAAANERRERKQRKAYNKGEEYVTSDEDDMEEAVEREKAEKRSKCYDCKEEFTDEEGRMALGCDLCDVAWWHRQCYIHYVPQGQDVESFIHYCDECKNEM